MVDSRVINSFKETSLKYIGNTNSLHKLGVDAKKLENAASKQIENLLHLNQKEIVYTSDRCEANSLAIFGILEKYKYKNKKVLFFDDCDNSIIDALNYIKDFGFYCYSVKSLDELKKLVDDQIILICTCNAKDVKLIKSIISDFKQINLFVDVTDNFDFSFDFNLVDLVSFDATSINAIKGIGCLIKNKNIILEPVLHGGKSTTSYRSGTPALPFIVSFSKALKIMYENYKYGNNKNE